MKRLLFLILPIVLLGCSGSGRLKYDGPRDAYEKGLARYDAEDYPRAIEYLQGVFDFGRTHEWAASAQLTLARAYRKNKDFLLAANEYTRFTQIFRVDPRVPQAQFELAMTYYDRSPAYQLDQTDTEQAITQFQLFITRYPTSDLVEDAELRIRELREKLARKRFAAASQYERRGSYQAAALTFATVFDDYYDSRWADDALVGAIRNFNLYAAQSIPARQAERYQKSVENYERLLQIFPDSPLLKEAEALYQVAAEQLATINSGSSS